MTRKLFFILIGILVTVLIASSIAKDAPAQTNYEINKPTFISEGTLNTLTGNNNTWILGGNWIMQSLNGKIDNFNMDITMVAQNGTDRHHMTIPISISLLNNLS